jgi:hypothetical protein
VKAMSDNAMFELADRNLPAIKFNEILLVHPFPPPFPKVQGKGRDGGLRHPGKKAQRQKRPSLLKFVNSAAKTILSSSALPKGRHHFLRCIVFLYGDGIFSGV